MSNDLITSTLLPGGKAVEIVNAPLRSLAPVLQVAAQCQPELDQLYRDRDKIACRKELTTNVERWVEDAKYTRAALLPRAIEVRQASDMLLSIYRSEQNVDTPMALKMVSVLHRVYKKKADPVSLMAYAALFDQDVDALGTSLDLWKEVPKHPFVVALAVHYLVREQIFPPVPAELCKACRKVAARLKGRLREIRSWLDTLSHADVVLCKYDHDNWVALYSTPESLKVAEAFVDIHNNSAWEEARDKRNAALSEMRMLAIESQNNEE
jgi:hypothetical protein